MEESDTVKDPLGGKRYFGLVDSDANKKKGIQDDPIDVERRQKVKGAMLHAWTSYEKYAWGNDELQVCILRNVYFCITSPFILINLIFFSKR